MVHFQTCQPQNGGAIHEGGKGAGGTRCFYDFQIAMGNVHISKMNIEQPSHQRIYKGMCHLSHTPDQYLILTMGEGEE